uniref:Translation initiation factor IF-2 n=2 Tax=Stomoxys calcitrans TaxID=35570 RepID=A0A1I8QB60_STOCA
MNFSLALIVVVGLIASGSALPAKKRMIYYQQPAQYYANPQRMMYVQYVQPARPYARSTQAAEALVAGETVATGTYLNDCNQEETDIAAAGPAVDVAVEHGEDILSEAVAYPAAGEETPTVVAVSAVPVETDVVAAEENEVTDESAKVPRDYNFEAAASADEAAAAAATAEEEATYTAEAEQAAAAEIPTIVEVETPVAAELPAPAPLAPVAKPARRYLPSKKKVFVQLDQSAESQEDTELSVADAEEEEYIPVAPVASRRPVAKKPAKAASSSGKPQKPLPAGTFFPINFGGTSGGAIAIANSFSTGEGGSATSHAIAYGSPDGARVRSRPSKFHH